MNSNKIKVSQKLLIGCINQSYTDLFKFCYPKSYKNSNKFGASSLLIMGKRGHEVDMEYSKKDIYIYFIELLLKLIHKLFKIYVKFMWSF